MTDVDRGYSTTGPTAPAPIPPLESLMARATAPTPDPVATLLVDRKKTHGDFSVHAQITQELKRAFYGHLVAKLSDVQAESVDMILHKLGRVAAGDPNFPDHWEDIQGYARLVSERLAWAK